jgi:MFS family permease
LRRKPFVLAGIIGMGIGLAILVGFSGWWMVMVASVLIGASFWIFYSLGVAMITQKLPSASNRGKDLGVINIASTLPQIIMPLVGAMVVSEFGAENSLSYQILFLIGCVATSLAVILMRSNRLNVR